ncbi:MAG: YggT family protein [Candidatus Promineifilaceae bacterium]|nr:YggT family protein [Candidatus Promineifilaceae bacterium]
MIAILFTIINLAYWFIVILVFARIILSFVNIGGYELRELVYRLTEPMLAPIRQVLPPSGGFDFSPMILLLAAYIVREIVRSILIGLLL